MNLLLHIAAQLFHRAVDDDIEQKGLAPSKQRGSEVKNERQKQYPSDRIEVDADPGNNAHTGEHVGQVVLTLVAQPFDGLFLGQPRGQLPADNAVEDQVGCSAEDVGAEDIEDDRCDREHQGQCHEITVRREPEQQFLQ